MKFLLRVALENRPRYYHSQNALSCTVASVGHLSSTYHHSWYSYSILTSTWAPRNSARLSHSGQTVLKQRPMMHWGHKSVCVCVYSILIAHHAEWCNSTKKTRNCSSVTEHMKNFTGSSVCVWERESECVCVCVCVGVCVCVCVTLKGSYL